MDSCVSLRVLFIFVRRKTITMKKTLILLFVSASLALVSCGGETKEDTDQHKKDSVSSDSSYEALMKKAEEAANDTITKDTVK